jgi:hypothetical protein
LVPRSKVQRSSKTFKNFTKRPLKVLDRSGISLEVIEGSKTYLKVVKDSKTSLKAI